MACREIETVAHNFRQTGIRQIAHSETNASQPTILPLPIFCSPDRPRTEIDCYDFGVWKPVAKRKSLTPGTTTRDQNTVRRLSPLPDCFNPWQRWQFPSPLRGEGRTHVRVRSLFVN